MNKKKLLALLMALVMTLSLMPVTAFAEGDAQNDPVYVAQIGEDTSKRYTKLQDAVAHASAGDTITLINDAIGIGSGGIQVSKNLILDLNGHTIDNGDDMIMTVAGATLTIKDDKGNGQIITNYSNDGAFLIFAFMADSAIVLEGGTIINHEGSPFGTVSELGHPSVEIKGGNVVTDNSVVITTTGGTATLKISGGEIEAAALSAESKEGHGGTVSVTIEGGSFKGITASTTANTIGDKPVAEGRKVVQDGDWYKVVPDLPNVAQIDSTPYTTLAEAIAAVPTNGTQTTITMIEDSVEPAVITVEAGKNIILDLAGHTISYVCADPEMYFITNKGTLTVRDSSAGETGKITAKTTNPDPGYGKENVTLYNLGGTLNLESGTIENTTTSGLAYAVNNSSNAWAISVVSTFNMTGGTVSAPQGDAALRVYQNTGISWKVESKNYVNISGGTIDNGIFFDTFLYTKNENATDFNATDIARGCVIDSEVNITGGTVNGLIDMKIRHPYSTVMNISDGDFTNAKLWVRKVSNEYGKNLSEGNIPEPTEPMVNISGGKWSFVEGKAFGLAYDCSGTSWTSDTQPYYVTGGVFNVDLNTYNSIKFEDGKTGIPNTDAETMGAYPYTVGVEAQPVAEVNGTPYTTLAEAIAAAADGGTVKLLLDIALDHTTTIEKSITIDGNHKSLTVTGGNDANKFALYVVDGNVKEKLNVAIKDLNMTTTGYQVAVMLNCDYYSKIALNNVDINCDGECVYANGHASASAQDCEFTRSGTYTAGKDAVYYSALVVGYGGEIIASDCKITGDGTGVGTFPSGGTVTLNNTDITIVALGDETNPGLAIWSRNEDYTNLPEYNCDSVITFHSGKVSGDFKITDKYTTGSKNEYAPKIVIDGGIFSVKPDTAYIAPGYKVIANTDPDTGSTYGWTIDVDNTAFNDVTYTDSQDAVTTTNTNTTFSFATTTTANPNDDVTYAIKTTTTGGQDTQEAYTPVQTDIVTKPAVSQNAANVSSKASETTVNDAKAAVEASAESGTTEIQAKQDGGTYGDVNLLTTQAAAKAITEAAAAYTGAANDIAKVEIQLQTELTSYTLADKNNAVATTALIYQVTPKAVLLNASGEQLSAETLTNIDLAAQDLTLKFRLPVPDSAYAVSDKVIVTHHSDGYGDSTSVLTVEGNEGNRYVVIETTHFSEFELKPYVVADANKLIDASLTLGTSLDINFYMQLTESVKSIRFTFTDEAENESVKTVAVTADKYDSSTGEYKFSYPVAAKDIYQTIKLEMLDVDGHPAAFNDDLYEFPYSVTTYLNTIISGGSGVYGEKMVPLARALGVYGSYAHDQILGTSKYTRVSDSNYGTISEGSYSAIDNGISAYVVGGYDVVNSYPSGDLHNPGMTLLLRTETVVANRFDYAGSDFRNYKFYYQHADANGSFTNSPEYQVEPVHTGSYWYVESNGIPAAELNRTIKFIIKSGNDVVYSTNYGPMFYANSKVTSATASDLVKNTARALYDYNQKAIDVFSNN